MVFRYATEMGVLRPDHGMDQWVTVGGVVPDLLKTPYSGRREISVVVFLIDLDRTPPCRHGSVDPDHPGVLWGKVLSFTHNFEEPGYMELSENRETALELTIRIAMGVAMADGEFHKTEAATISGWIDQKKLDACLDDERRDQLSELFERAYSSAQADAKTNSLVLSQDTAQLNEIGERSSKYETLKLCFDVMAADGIADDEELRVIRGIAEALDLDFDEVQKMRDVALIGLDQAATQQTSMEELLEIDPQWPRAKIKRHLMKLFQKWNNRLNTLPEGQEREQAQYMLTLIGQARRQYEE